MNLKRTPSLSPDLPNFLIVGAQKCGTTALHSTLSQHEQIFMTVEKELNFFTNEFSLGLDNYRKHFRAATQQHLVLGEASPGYMCHPLVAKRIHDSLGEIKVVMLLRDPIRRAVSQYWDTRRKFGERLTFPQAIKDYLETTYMPGKKGYFSRGIYIDYIERFCQLFALDKIHVMIFEELVACPEVELPKLYHFLGVDNDSNLNRLRGESNKALVYRNSVYQFLFQNPQWSFHLPKRMRRLAMFGATSPLDYQIPTGDELKTLQNFYSDSVERLEKFLGRQINWPLTKGGNPSPKVSLS